MIMNAPTAITPSYRHTPLFPLGPERTPYRKLNADGVRVEKINGRELVMVEREALRALAEESVHRYQSLAAARPSQAAARDSRRPRGLRQRSLRRLRLPQEREHRGGRRAAHVPGHRHRDHHGQEGTARFH